MFGFFFRTNKTFRLILNNSCPLKSYSRLCSNGSKIYPHIIPELSQIIPQIIPLTEELNNIPLFIAAEAGPDNMLSMLDPTIKNSSFYLVFYPQNPPTNSQVSSIIDEYWKSIKPMIICRDMGGYYLGSSDDPNIAMFEQCTSEQAECRISKIISEYNEFTMQTEKNPIFSNVSINLRKIK